MRCFCRRLRLAFPPVLCYVATDYSLLHPRQSWRCRDTVFFTTDNLFAN